MLLSDRDVSYLIDMSTCCDDIQEFVREVTYEEFEQDRMRRLATERQLQVLGEAAGRVSAEAQSFLSQIEWRKIIGLRNKLAHDYGEILARRVWQISQVHVPDLSQKLNSIAKVREIRSTSKDS